MSDNRQQGEKKKKETILDLQKYLDKKIRVKFSGGREASGILKGTNKSNKTNLKIVKYKYNNKYNKRIRPSIKYCPRHNN